MTTSYISFYKIACALKMKAEIIHNPETFDEAATYFDMAEWCWESAKYCRDRAKYYRELQNNQIIVFAKLEGMR